MPKSVTKWSKLSRKRDWSGNPFFVFGQKKIVAESPVLFFRFCGRKGFAQKKRCEIGGE